MRTQRYSSLLAAAFVLGSPAALYAAEQWAEHPPAQKLAVFVAILILAICAKAGLLALMLLYSLLRPQTVQRGSEVLRAHPIQSLIAGVLAAAILVVLMALADNLPEAAKAIPVLALLLPCCYWGIAGLSMISHDLGDRLLSNVNSARLGSSALAVCCGGLIILMAGFMPVVGQLVQFVAGVLALGLALSTLANHKRRQDKCAPAELENAADA